MRTRVSRLLGVEYPIVAFSHCRDVVAAVSNAGGFGVLGAVAHTPELLETELSWIEEQTAGKPYGVHLLLPPKYVGAQGVVRHERRDAAGRLGPEPGQPSRRRL
jgi:NAD(P)H-dependent flavin oxidoreductase YrpB (nitropropane dioxygenase family)